MNEKTCKYYIYSWIFCAGNLCAFLSCNVFMAYIYFHIQWVVFDAIGVTHLITFLM